MSSNCTDKMQWGLQVRVIKDSANKTIEEAGPSVAMLVVGLNSVPVAGDEFTVMDSEQEVSCILQTKIVYPSTTLPCHC